MVIKRFNRILTSDKSFKYVYKQSYLDRGYIRRKNRIFIESVRIRYKRRKYAKKILSI